MVREDRLFMPKEHKIIHEQGIDRRLLIPPEHVVVPRSKQVPEPIPGTEQGTLMGGGAVFSTQHPIGPPPAQAPL